MSTWREFEKQMDDCDIQAFADKKMTSVVIRTDQGDHHVAACHLEGTSLVMDLGQIIHKEG